VGVRRGFATRPRASAAGRCGSGNRLIVFVSPVDKDSVSDSNEELCAAITRAQAGDSYGFESLFRLLGC
jgi:hypothetical protein